MKKAWFLLILFVMVSVGNGPSVWARVGDPLSENYYERLAVEATASPAEIKLAYRRMASKYHPDKNPGIDDKYFKKIGEAGEVLLDATARAQYDATLRSSTAAAAPMRNEEHAADRSTEPLGWKLFVGRAWDSSRPPAVNYFRNLPLVPETSRGYLYTLINQLDWSAQGNAAKYFYPLARAYVESYVELDFVKMNALEIQEASKQLDAIMHLPQAVLFPDLVTVLIKGGRMDYVLGHLLNQKNWMQTPEFKLWIEKVPHLRCRALFL